MAVKGPYSAERPICKHEKTDCNLRSEDGSCDLLLDTDFDKPCPFYKSVSEQAAYGARRKSS